MTPSDAPTRTARESGFTVVAILLLVSVMASLAATMSRHVIVDAKATVVSGTMQESMALLESQIDYALQSRRVARTADPLALDGAIAGGSALTSDEVGHAAKELTVVELDASSDDGRTSLFSSVLTDGGIGATRLVEFGVAPAALATSPDTLPTLDEDLAWDVLGHGSVERLDITSDRTLSGVSYTGFLVVHEGATLTLDDVVLTGSVLSAAAEVGRVSSSFSEFLAPRLVITGPVRILSDELPDLAVLMPDGVVVAESADARLQIVGDVVAYDVDVLSSGSIDGRVMTVLEPAISPDVDRPGSRRAPRDWSGALDDLGAEEPTFLAVVPRVVTWEDVTAITSYTLPARPSSASGTTPSGGSSGKGSGSSGSSGKGKGGA